MEAAYPQPSFTSPHGALGPCLFNQLQQRHFCTAAGSPPCKRTACPLVHLLRQQTLKAVLTCGVPAGPLPRLPAAAPLSSLLRAQIVDAAAGKDFSFFHGLTPDTPASHTLLHGAVTVTDPALFVDASSKINNIISGATLSATFLSYAPCLILNQPYGFGVFPFGLNVQPTGIYIVPAGFNVQPQGFNVAPTLIYVGPVGRNIAPQGFNVAPALISVAPVRHGLLSSESPSQFNGRSVAPVCANV